MARSLAFRLSAVAVAAGISVTMALMFLITPSSVAASSAHQTVVPIGGSVAPLVLLRVEGGTQLVVQVDPTDRPGAGGAKVISFPRALTLQVVANAPWKLTLVPAGEFPVQLLLSSVSAAGAVQVRPDGTGGVGAYGQAGQLRLTWDVTVVVPPGTPEGVYAVPLMMELATV